MRCWVCVQDDVRPISCRGHDSQGGIAITLIDALDTLLVRPPHEFSGMRTLLLHRAVTMDQGSVGVTAKMSQRVCDGLSIWCSLCGLDGRAP